MAAVFLTGFSATLSGSLTASALSLPLSAADAARLCAALASDHSYLHLSDGAGNGEIVRVSCSAGVPVIVRGDPARSFPMGACIKFEVVPQLLTDFVLPEVCIEASGPIKVEKDTEGCFQLSFEFEGPEFSVGCDTYQLPTGTPESSNTPVLAAGSYINPTVSINSCGEIDSIEEGDALYTGSEGMDCGCQSLVERIAELEALIALLLARIEYIEANCCGAGEGPPVISCPPDQP